MIWGKYLLAILVVCAIAAPVSAATFYVDATGGVDTNDGLSPAAAWKTVAKVNGSTFSAGDQILFKRGQVWNESLVPPSSGVSGNPIVFDAYGTGEAPTLTGYVPLAAPSWTADIANVWKTSITSSSFNYVLFGYIGSDGTVGSVWGTKFTSGKSALVAPYQFYFSSNVLYVYSPTGTNPATYYGSMAAMLMTNGQVIYINGKSWLTIQHFKVTYFDTYGVRIGGASDHITIANVYSDGVIPAGTTPHGFYMNVSPAATDMKFYNVDSHRNYNGFRFDGPGSGVVLKNCRAYGNRNHGLDDSMTGGGSNYSFCHFYANGLGVVTSTDIVGGTNGGNNVAAYTAPATASFQKYPARITLTVDDPGLIGGADAYIDSILPLFDARGVQLSAAIVTGYDVSNTLISKFQSWINAGRDVVSHSWSHQYFQAAPAMTIKYTGTGSAATMTVSGTTLTTTVTGGPGGENLSFDLTNASFDTVSELVTAINTHSGYTATLVIATTTDSVTLTPISGQDLKAATFTEQFRNASAFGIRYTGTGTAATMTISGNVLTTTVTGGPGGENLSFDLTNASYDTMSELSATINGRSGYSAAQVSTGKGAAHTITLADVAAQDIKSAKYIAQVLESRLEPDEMASSKAWMTANLTGLPTSRVLVYPGGQEDSSTQGYAVTAGYAGSRGAFTMDLGTKDVYSRGANIQNITSFGANPNLQGLSTATLDAMMAALVWKSSVWGAPYGVFWHIDELSSTEVATLLDGLLNHGATLMTNTQLINFLAGQTLSGTANYYWAPATGLEADLGAGFAFDLEGVDQRVFGSGWEMGSFVIMGQAPFVVVVQ
jgi:hypothetical protein